MSTFIYFIPSPNKNDLLTLSWQVSQENMKAYSVFRRRLNKVKDVLSMS